MNLQYRIELLTRLGQYLLSDDPQWTAIKDRAERENGWFTQEFIEKATRSIALEFLKKEKLENWTAQYVVADAPLVRKNVGVVMAGNLPLVGFHDWLCCFISGHHMVIKPSSKDTVLLKHLLAVMTEWEPEMANYYQFSEFLKGCDAYIATGSNNSAGYFDYYFSKYPHIIRRNRTSIALLTGKETSADLQALADDVHLYFGLGCRNVTKIYTPRDYDFVPLLESFKKYLYLADHHKYKNNYDYNLAIQILNKKFYMTNGSILLVEDPGFFSPISQLHYEFYEPGQLPALIEGLNGNDQVQTIAGTPTTPFGKTQQPSLTDYADGVDTLQFLVSL